jgi:hypothetical protein
MVHTSEAAYTRYMREQILAVIQLQKAIQQFYKSRNAKMGLFCPMPCDATPIDEHTAEDACGEWCIYICIFSWLEE